MDHLHYAEVITTWYITPWRSRPRAWTRSWGDKKSGETDPVNCSLDGVDLVSWCSGYAANILDCSIDCNTVLANAQPQQQVNSAHC